MTFGDVISRQKPDLGPLPDCEPLEGAVTRVEGSDSKVRRLK